MLIDNGIDRRNQMLNGTGSADVGGLKNVTPAQRFHAIAASLLTRWRGNFLCVHPVDREARTSSHISELFCCLDHIHQRPSPLGHTGDHISTTFELPRVGLPFVPWSLWIRPAVPSHRRLAAREELSGYKYGLHAHVVRCCV